MSLDECFKKLEKLNIKIEDGDRFVLLKPKSYPYTQFVSPLGIIHKKCKCAFIPTRGYLKRNNKASPFQREAMKRYDEMLSVLEDEGCFLRYYTDMKDI